MAADRLTPTPISWSWPQIDQPLDLSGSVFQHWNHDGDSVVWKARPRKHPGQPLPQTAYLVKRGRDALGEVVYSTIAQRFGLPSAVAVWTTRQEQLEAAIRFETEAWHPTNIDPLAGRATASAREERLMNPLDWYRHLALSQFLQENDQLECMVQRGILFRIDAASAGSTLVNFATRSLAQTGERQEAAALQRDISLTLRSLYEETPTGCNAYRSMLTTLAEDRGLAEEVAEAVLLCSAIVLQNQQPPKGEVGGPAAFFRLAEWVLTSPLLAETISIYLLQQQQTIKQTIKQMHI